MKPFSDPESIADYAQRTMRLVPGLLDMHRMSALLLAERAPSDGRVLVVGAGGGMEIRSLAQHNPAWQFCGIDPSAEMLDLARRNIGAVAPSVELHEGYVASAPPGPFDAAVCLLTMHFMAEPERRETLQEIRRRLRPGSPFVTRGA